MSASTAASPELETAPQARELARALSLRDAIALVLTVIGTGVFLKTATMAQLVGSPNKVLLAWVAAGLLSLAGALTYAELGAMMPEAGGEYVFLREAYGDLPAFLFGWSPPSRPRSRHSSVPSFRSTPSGLRRISMCWGRSCIGDLGSSRSSRWP